MREGEGERGREGSEGGGRRSRGSERKGNREIVEERKRRVREWKRKKGNKDSKPNQHEKKLKYM